MSTITASNQEAFLQNGRIENTRITIHDVYYYVRAGRSAQEIREILDLTDRQVDQSLVYVAEHERQLAESFEEVEARIARGNPPEIQSKENQARARLEEWRKESKSTKGKAQ